MLDTKPDMQQKQREIILSKTPQERFLIGAETIDFGRTLVESSIIQNEPNISELDLKIRMLQRYYSDFYSTDEMGKIITSLKKYVNLNKKK